MDLFQGQLTTLVDGNLVVSVGDYWVAVSQTTAWDAMVKPQVIIDYVNGIVIPHMHEMTDIVGLAAALDLKYDIGDTADHTIDFNLVSDQAIIELEFLKTWYYTKSEIEDLVLLTFENGLTEFNNTVTLGGDLIDHVVFVGTGAEGVNFVDINYFRVESDPTLGGDYGEFVVDYAQLSYQNTNNTDNSSNFFVQEGLSELKVQHGYANRYARISQEVLTGSSSIALTTEYTNNGTDITSAYMDIVGSESLGPGLDQFGALITFGVIDITGLVNSLTLDTVAGAVYTDNLNLGGIKYADNYHAFYTGRSLIDLEFLQNYVDSAGGIAWQVITGDVSILAGDIGYIVNNTVLTTLTLEDDFPGKIIRVTGSNTGNWKILVSSPIFIQFGEEVATDHLQSNDPSDAVELLNVGTNRWQVISAIGGITFT